MTSSNSTCRAAGASIAVSGRPLIAQLLPLLGAEGAHALLHFSALKPSDPASVSCELAAGREARTQLHQLLRSEPSLKPLEAQTRARKLTSTDLVYCPLTHKSRPGQRMRANAYY